MPENAQNAIPVENERRAHVVFVILPTWIFNI